METYTLTKSKMTAATGRLRRLEKLLLDEPIATVLRVKLERLSDSRRLMVRLLGTPQARQAPLQWEIDSATVRNQSHSPRWMDRFRLDGDAAPTFTSSRFPGRSSWLPIYTVCASPFVAAGSFHAPLTFIGALFTGRV